MNKWKQFTKEKKIPNTWFFESKVPYKNKNKNKNKNKDKSLHSAHSKH